MFYVYVLLDKNKNFYIGYSSDLKARFSEHLAKKVFATKHKLPLTLIYYESCLHKYDALNREKYLKSGPGRKFLKGRLKRYLNEKLTSAEAS